MATLTVTLAEVPTDVLVHLADCGPGQLDEITRAVAPPGTQDAEDAVASAVALLTEGGWVVRGEHGWDATDTGRAAVATARRKANAS